MEESHKVISITSQHGPFSYNLVGALEHEHLYSSKLFENGSSTGVAGEILVDFFQITWHQIEKQTRPLQCLCTGCKPLWGKSVICENGPYTINWIELNCSVSGSTSRGRRLLPRGNPRRSPLDQWSSSSTSSRSMASWPWAPAAAWLTDKMRKKTNAKDPEIYPGPLEVRSPTSYLTPRLCISFFLRCHLRLVDVSGASVQRMSVTCILSDQYLISHLYHSGANYDVQYSRPAC